VIRLAALLALLCGPAMAQQTQCPGSNQSWSFTLPAPMQFAVYDLLGIPGVSPGMLSVLYLNRSGETFFGVPQATAQRFQQAANQQQFYSQQIKPVYHEMLLLQGSNCPLLTSTPGALWTK